MTVNVTLHIDEDGEKDVRKYGDVREYLNDLLGSDVECIRVHKIRHDDDDTPQT